MRELELSAHDADLPIPALKKMDFWSSRELGPMRDGMKIRIVVARKSKFESKLPPGRLCRWKRSIMLRNFSNYAPQRQR
jgi:predicted amino acid dehydrogenase